MELIAIYVTYASEEEAQKIVIILLEKRLIACANVYPVNSFFRWNGKIENENEYVSILKSGTSKINEIITAIQALHSYDIPCITYWNINSESNYGGWINDQIQY